MSTAQETAQPLTLREPSPEYTATSGLTETRLLSVPADLYARLQDYATATGKRLEQVTADILTKKLQRIKPQTEREQFLAAMKKSGLTVRPLSDDLSNLIVPGVKHEEVEAAFARAGGTPLSEIIMEQRGPLP